MLGSGQWAYGPMAIVNECECNTPRDRVIVDHIVPNRLIDFRINRPKSKWKTLLVKTRMINCVFYFPFISNLSIIFSSWPLIIVATHSKFGRIFQCLVWVKWIFRRHSCDQVDFNSFFIRSCTIQFQFNNKRSTLIPYYGLNYIYFYSLKYYYLPFGIALVYLNIVNQHISLLS